jgi:putative tryptophan/tyrosine transport system substrate-binding protein
LVLGNAANRLLDTAPCVKLTVPGLVTAGGLLLLAAALGVEAQPAGSMRTVGVLLSRPEVSRPFEEGLRELGWVEGKSIRFERRFSTDYQKLSRLAAELTRIPVDVVFAGNAPSTRAAMEITQTVPIITVSGDPVSAGFVVSLARPGANVTGLAIMHTELSGKRLEILTQALPAARRIAILANPANPATAAMRRETEARATALGVQLLPFEATAPEQLAVILATAAQKHPDALVVFGDPMFFLNRRHLLEAAARHRLPAIWEWREFAEAGGLMAYGPSLDDLYRRAAKYVDRVLSGAKPADLPVEQATKFDLVINLKTAKALGLTIPPSVLLRAAQVLE